MIVVLTLALGIGANVSIFSVVSRLLLKPFAFPDLERLVLIRWRAPGPAADDVRLPAPVFLDMQREARSFSSTAAFRYRTLNLGSKGQVEGVSAAEVTANYFDVLGAGARLGRTFQPVDSTEAAGRLVVLRYGLWRRKFAADPSIVGRDITIDGLQYTVAGIMPETFRYPLGVELWMPLQLTQAERMDRANPALHAIGRLNSRIFLASAQSDIRIFAQSLARRYPATDAGKTLDLLRVREEQYRYTVPLFLSLQAAAACFLLMACANLANLLLTRMLGREREVAIRAALGANRARLLQSFLCETILLAALGGAVSVGVSLWSVEAIRTGIPAETSKWISGWDHINVDGPVLLFAVLLSLLVGLALGLIAALRGPRSEIETVLREGGRAATDSRRGRLRGALAGVQIVAAMVLLVCAASLVTGFLRLIREYRGFDAANVQSMLLSVPKQRYDEGLKVAGFYQEVLRRVAALPGVESASLISTLPASGEDASTDTVTIEGRPVPQPGSAPSADVQIVSAGIFGLLRIPLLGGRLLSDRDTTAAPRVAVISSAMARQHWPNQNATGHRFKLGSNPQAPWITVAGVVGDVRQNWYEPASAPTIYLPYLQEPSEVKLLVRTRANPASSVGAIRAAVRTVDAEVPITEVETLEEAIAIAMAPVRIIWMLMLIFGLLALGLSVVGVYGVLAFGVARRTREFAMRLALGARPADLLKMVAGQSVRLSAIAISVALPAGFAVTRILSSLLFGMAPLGFPTLTGMLAVVTLAILAAGILPAFRAMRIDPIAALRNE